MAQKFTFLNTINYRRIAACIVKLQFAQNNCLRINFKWLEIYCIHMHCYENFIVINLSSSHLCEICEKIYKILISVENATESEISHFLHEPVITRFVIQRSKN